MRREGRGSGYRVVYKVVQLRGAARRGISDERDFEFFLDVDIAKNL